MAVRVAIWLSKSHENEKSVNRAVVKQAWKKNRNRKKKASMESKLPCLLPSMLRHTKQAELMG